VAALSIRDLDDDVKERLRRRAAGNGRSMEAEARLILADAVREPEPAGDLLSALVDMAQEFGGIALDIPPRTRTMRVVDFDS